eukprot:g399.t1
MIEYFQIGSIVISPGPGQPNNPLDTGICLDLVKKLPKMPILGVCLGHQILAEVYGAKTKRVRPVHGRLSCIRHNSHPLFDKIPSKEFSVVRYHSLAVDENSLPQSIDPIAWTHGITHAIHGQCAIDYSPNSVLMALAHKELPHYGVQFHPESIGTDYGVQLLKNFKQISERVQKSKTQSKREALKQMPSRVNGVKHTPSLRVIWKQSPIHIELERAEMDELFEWFVGSNFEDTFWLDSAHESQGRFSYLGKKGGKLWRQISYKLKLEGSTIGVLTEMDAHGYTTTHCCSLWDYLESILYEYYVLPESELPFDFHGGFVGYLGYELKALCGGKKSHEAAMPDASMFFSDQFLAIDHKHHRIYCVSLVSLDSSQEGQSWIDSTLRELNTYLLTRSISARNVRADTLSGDGTSSLSESFCMDRDHEEYQREVDLCKEYLYSGESYEICLTNQFRKLRPESFDSWVFYRLLRMHNPAPFAAWLSFQEDDLTICCSSPERFLKGDQNRTLEAKPIKGTTARKQDPIEDERAAKTLAASEKDQAENLMIVDLLRNDLGRVCQSSSVHVPSLIEVESYQTVHQLVSTIRGVLAHDHSIIDAIKAAFPGGSMVGAPKVRSMEILDRLEGRARGVYSGSLGYISVNHTFDLNIIIRSVVITREELTIGAGGAIVVQSDPRKEFEEMNLKARILLDILTLSQMEVIIDKRITKLPPTNKIKDSL